MIAVHEIRQLQGQIRDITEKANGLMVRAPGHLVDPLNEITNMLVKADMYLHNTIKDIQSEASERS